MPSKDSQEMYPGRPGPITPVANIGDNLAVLRRDATYLFRVLFREGLPPSIGLIRDFGALAIGAGLNDQSLQAQLEMPDSELGQFRMFVLDDFRITVKQVRAIGRFAAKNVVATISQWSHQIDPCDHLTEFFVYKDEWPWFDVLNTSGVALAQSRVAFYGFRYGMEQIGRYTALRDIPAAYQAVVAQGVYTASPSSSPT